MTTRLASTAVLFSLFGTLNFEGQIVESGCTVQAVPNRLAGADAMPVDAATSLQITEYNDACANRTRPFTAQYLPLSASENDRENRVITLTYN